MDAADLEISVVPANQASWEELQAVFGTKGPASRCQCQRFKLARGESFGNFPTEERRHRLRVQTACGDPEAVATSGLLARLGTEPVGWCAVEPRPAYDGLVRNSSRAAWVGREEDRLDPSVWAVTCVLTRAGYRRAGVSRALVLAAVPFARNRGARALEGYPMTTTTTALLEELHTGTLSTFLDAGFTEVHRPSLRRAVVRIDF
jgi:GNAT superfamily N-acetyltransferase